MRELDFFLSELSEHRARDSKPFFRLTKPHTYPRSFLQLFTTNTQVAHLANQTLASRMLSRLSILFLTVALALSVSAAPVLIARRAC